MIRKAAVMKVYKEHFAEYERRHDELWPEMKHVLKEHGVSNYSIFLDEKTEMLFAYMEIENEEIWSKISKSPIVRKWWKYMDPIMETNGDCSPVQRDIKSVFYLP